MPSHLRASEWISLGYFVYLALVAILPRGIASLVRLRVVATSLLLVALIVVIGPQTSVAAAVVRDWLPLLFIVAGYWLPALLVVAPKERVERALRSFDRRLFSESGLARFVEHAPRYFTAFLEIAYLFCYPLVPLGFAWLLLGGFRAEVDHFWSIVLLAAFGCYGLLPWLPTRPPRAFERTCVGPVSGVRALNLLVLDRASVGLNTFPSGHAAASIATALAVGIHIPIALFMLGVIAAGITIGSVVGRYHYAADALAGMAIALASYFLIKGV